MNPVFTFRIAGHMWINVLKDPEQWAAFASAVKQANHRRPALQEEFAKVIPGYEYQKCNGLGTDYLNSGNVKFFDFIS
jgi:hypothetical protein